jgi:hypothetical protein
MKKPAGGGDEKPAHTAEPKDEFSKLEQQYDSASIEERDRLHPHFMRALRKKHPRLLEKTWRALRNGDGLKVTLRDSMKRVLGRHDLSAGRKTNAREDADAAMWLIDELQRNDLKPKTMRGHGYELATRMLFVGLRAGFSPKEVENLHARFMSDRQREIGKKPKKESPRAAYARGLACDIVKEKEDQEFRSEEIVEEIPNRWQRQDLACFTDSWLRILVRRWIRDGVIPPPTPSRRRRTYPLRRFRQF